MDITLYDNLLEAVKDYISGEEGYGDNTLVEINLSDNSVELVDEEPDTEDDDTLYAYFPVMDLISMSVQKPGEWIADNEAVKEVVNYITTKR